ncbi:hypothetical protein [Haloferax volcanii]|uniref:Uncharacterized protein n=1 Tax=Haloferax volcanii TaxID=2246 RepID=A0A558FWF1_HALVO|nr:hypothetical protein [Haloferax volcanii]TVT89848.1 hypothetical protein FQA18_18250 [Haloferax volcanii]
MTDGDYFQRTIFGSEGEWQTPEEAIRDRHDPEIAYHHIVKLAGSINAGLDGIPDEKQTAAEAYAIADLFRATVQYVEEFGIYMRSQIEQDENFIKLLIQTSSGNLQQFYEACRDRKLTRFLKNRDRSDAPTFIDEVFGYQKIRDGNLYPREISENVPEDTTIEELIQDSETFIESELQEIATYYLNLKGRPTAGPAHP